MDIHDAIREVLKGNLCQRYIYTTENGACSYHRIWLEPDDGILQVELRWANDAGWVGPWYESQLADDDLTATNWKVVGE